MRWFNRNSHSGDWFGDCAWLLLLWEFEVVFGQSKDDAVKSDLVDDKVSVSEVKLVRQGSDDGLDE